MDRDVVFEKFMYESLEEALMDKDVERVEDIVDDLREVRDEGELAGDWENMINRTEEEGSWVVANRIYNEFGNKGVYKFEECDNCEGGYVTLNSLSMECGKCEGQGYKRALAVM